MTTRRIVLTVLLLLPSFFLFSCAEDDAIVGSCQRQLECGFLEDVEDAKDCSIEVNRILDHLELVSGNNAACTDLLEQYKQANDCVRKLDCAEMAETDGNGQTELQKCYKRFAEKVDTLRSEDPDKYEDCNPGCSGAFCPMEEGILWE